MKHINIIGLDVLDNQYFSRGVPKFCLPTWDRIVKSCEKLGYTAEIKIITGSDEEYSLFKENAYYKILEDKYNSKQIPQSIFLTRVADLFRIYMLSKYPNTLWLDADIYVSKDFDFVDIDKYDPYLPYFWYVLYNNSNTEVFKKILDEYNRGTFKNNESDKQVAYWIRDNLGIKLLDKSNKAWGLIHIPFSYYTHNNIPLLNIVTPEGINNPYLEENLSDRKNYYFVSLDNIGNSYERFLSCRGNVDLFEFVKEQCGGKGIVTITKEVVNKPE